MDSESNLTPQMKGKILDELWERIVEVELATTCRAVLWGDIEEILNSLTAEDEPKCKCGAWMDQYLVGDEWVWKCPVLTCRRMEVE